MRRAAGYFLAVDALIRERGYDGISLKDVDGMKRLLGFPPAPVFMLLSDLSGVEPATAMKILNSVMLLKSSESWGYAAIDLMCIDLFTGQAGFYKYGAAPSYIRSGRNVRRVKGMTMAAGVLAGEGEPPDVVRLHIRPGALAVIASDGVVTREDDTWLRRILLDDDGTDMRALARSVVHEAGERYGYKDDMTVLAIRLEERK